MNKYLKVAAGTIGGLALTYSLYAGYHSYEASWRERALHDLDKLPQAYMQLLPEISKEEAVFLGIIRATHLGPELVDGIKYHKRKILNPF